MYGNHVLTVLEKYEGVYIFSLLVQKYEPQRSYHHSRRILMA